MITEEVVPLVRAVEIERMQRIFSKKVEKRMNVIMANVLEMSIGQLRSAIRRVPGNRATSIIFLVR